MDQLFGEFLVEKGVVSVEEITAALVEQLAMVPPFPKIIFDYKLLRPEQLFKVLAQQSKERISFRLCCQKNGFWDDLLEQKMEQILRKYRVPLGQILVKRKKTNFSNIIEALDEYLFLKGKDVSVAPAPAPAPAPTSISTAVKATPTPTLKERKLDPAIIQNYLEYMSEDRHNDILAHLHIFQSSVKNNLAISEIELEIKQLYHIFHTIKGSARFIQAQLSESIISNMEAALLLLIPLPDKTEMNVLEDLSAMLDIAADLLWALRNAISADCCENGQSLMSDFSQSYENINDRLINFKADLQGRS